MDRETPAVPSADALFERYGATVYRRCLALLGSDEQAKDAVQEIFLRLLQPHAGFRGESGALTWLYAIATLHCLQQLRNRRRRDDKLREVAAAAEASELPRLDDRLALAALLEEQEPLVQQLVVLRHVDEMTVEEVAAAVGYSRKTVARKLQAFAEIARGRLGALEDAEGQP